MNQSSFFRGSVSSQARYLLLLAGTIAFCLTAACSSSHSAAPTPTPAVGPGKLAYVQDGNIWTMTLPDGSPRRITTSGQASAPRWSRSGDWLAFDDRANGAGTRVVRDDGSSLHDAPGFSAWSPVDDRFAAVSGGVLDQSDSIYVENADGSGHRIVPLPQPFAGTKVEYRGLAWSPDGRSLAYSMLAEATSGTPPVRAASLWWASADTDQGASVYAAGSPWQDDIVLVGWSPDGHALFFALDPSFSADVADGLPLQAIQTLPDAGSAPIPFAPSPATMLLEDGFWSPRTDRPERVAVVDGAGRETWTNKRIALLSWAAGTVVELTPPGVAAIDPAWSPDGQRIAYVAAPDAGTGAAGGDAAKAAMAQRKIWVMDTYANGQYGANQRQLTNDPAYRDERPQWTADGSHIVFARIDASDNVSLWIESAAGGAATPLAHGLPSETQSTPTWFGYYGAVDWGSMFSLWSPPAGGAPAAIDSLPEASPAVAPVRFPVAPADRDAPVWDFVRQWQGDHVSPILRPSFLPAGLDTVTVGQLPNKLDRDLLSVEYAGPGKTLVIDAGGLNPSPGGTNGIPDQRQVTVRGQPGLLSTTPVDDAGKTAEWLSLSWVEPGMRAGQISHPLYEVHATGLTEQELMRVAESLAPVGP